MQRRLTSLDRIIKTSAFYNNQLPSDPISHMRPEPVGLERSEELAKTMLTILLRIKNAIKNKDIYNMPADKIDKLRTEAKTLKYHADFLLNSLNGLDIYGDPEEFGAEEKQTHDNTVIDTMKTKSQAYYKLKTKKAGYWEEDSEAAEASGKETLAEKIGDPKKINQAWATPEGNTEFFNHVNKLKTELKEARKNNLKKTDVGYISDPEAYKVYLAKKDELYNFLAQYPFKEECNKCWGRGGEWGHGDFFGCEHCDETGYMFPTLEKVNHGKAMDEAHELAENKHREWKRQKKEDLEDRLDTSERYPDKEYYEPEVEEEEE
jgi:hypothetical protein